MNTITTRHPHQERTLVIIKPDGIQRSLIGEIISRFERTGLKFTAFKFLRATPEQCVTHYNKDDAWFQKKGAGIVEDLKSHGLPVEKEAIEYGRDIIDMNIRFMTAGPVLAFVIEGNQSVAIVKKLVGSTEPATSDVGTIRGDLTVDSYGHSAYQNRAVRNLTHCSDSPDEAEREIKIWFDEDEILQYATAQERILYDVDFNGTKE